MAPLTATAFRLASLVLQFAITMSLARVLGREQFGSYAFIFALMQVSVALGRGGLLNLLVRDVAMSLGKGDIATARGFLILGWTIAVPMAGLLAAVFGFALLPLLAEDLDVSARAVAAGAAFIAAMILVGMTEASLRGSGKVLIGQTAELLVRPIVQLTLVLLASAGLIGELIDFNFAIEAAGLAAVVALTVVLINYLRFTVIFGPRPLTWPKAGVLSSLLLLSGTAWFAALNSNLNIIILAYLGDEADVALFQVSLQLTATLQLGLIAVNASMAPKISRTVATAKGDDAPRLQHLASRSCEISLAFGLPLAAVYVMFGTTLIPLLFGAAYADAYWPTVILTIGQTINIGFGSVAVILYANRREDVVLKAIVASTIMNFALCVLMIPLWGAIGAAIAGGISMSLWNFISFISLLCDKGVICLPLVAKVRAKPEA